MSDKSPQPERDPAHREVSQETKDEFLLLVDECTQEGYAHKAAHGGEWRGKYHRLDDRRKVNMTFDTYRPNSAPGINQKLAAVIIDADHEDGNKDMTDRTVYELFRDGTFEKSVENHKKLEFIVSDTAGHKLLDEVKTLRAKIQSEQVSETEARELGLRLATEAEAREAIDVLKTIQEQQKQESARS